jgi:methyl-accepting chemotaxis protein
MKNNYHQAGEGGLFNDISALNGNAQGDQHPHASYNTYASVYDCVPLAILAIDGNGVLTYCNPGAERLFQLSPSEGLGVPVVTFIPKISNTTSDNRDVVTMQLFRKDRSTFQADVSFNKREGSSTIIFIHDVSGELHLQQQQNENLEMMQAQEQILREHITTMKSAQDELEQKQLEAEAQMTAINLAAAYIEFYPDGTIIKANDLFLKAVKYSQSEIVAKHHRIFCDVDYANSPEYAQFWHELQQGKAQVGEFKRKARDGSTLWMLANYTPVFDKTGKVSKVIKLASDITREKLAAANYRGQIDAISKSQAVIEFDMNGYVLHANENFLTVMDYSLAEIKGRHHSMFADSRYTRSQEYKDFWAKLNRGEFLSGEYTRIGKGNKPVWIQASYNPIFDLDGKPFKVVKYATDITREKHNALDVQGQLDAIGRSNAVIEFAMDGTVTDANDNFLNVIGYSLDEIRGKHHRMFVDPEYARSMDYRNFWTRLNQGEFFVGTYTRLNKKGEEIYIQASYNPIKDEAGNTIKVVKFALDMTEVIRVIKAMSKGDFSLRCDTSRDNGGLTSQINETLENLTNVLVNINHGAEVVSKSSRLLNAKVEDLRKSAAEVASAISQIAQGAQDQASRTDESSRLISMVKNSSEDMESKANVISKAAEKGLNSSSQGMATIKLLVNNMNGIQDSAGETAQSISILTERAEQITRTLNVITEIASQTNLLALNAAIEAARAGDSGRGFSVVAEEIRKLAEGSRKSAVEIDRIIRDVQKDTRAAAAAIEAMGLSVKQGNESTSEVLQIFTAISSSSDQTFGDSQKIQIATIEQKSSIETVVRNFDQIVVVAEETAAGTQQVAMSSQLMNTGMIEISKAGEELSAVANELRTGIKQFKLRN